MAQVTFKPGKITFVNSDDVVLEPAYLRVELLNDAGHRIGEVRIPSKLPHKGEAEAVDFFAFSVDLQRRKRRYLKAYPLDADRRNRGRIEREIEEDFLDWLMRKRRDKERFEGVDDETMRAYGRRPRRK